MSQAFETTDIGAAEHLIRASYGGNLRIDPRGPLGAIRVEQSPVNDAVRLDRFRLAISFHARADPLGVITIGHSRSGRAAYNSDGNERRLGPGDVRICVQPDHPHTAICDDLEIDIAAIDPAAVGNLAATAPGRRVQPVRFIGYEPVSHQAAQLWANTYAYVSAIATDPAAATQPLVAASAARLLAAAALTTFPNTALTDPTIEDRRDAHLGSLRRAVAFIDENAHTDISVADIANAAHVTVRAVQLAFHRHLGTTPTAYLRQVRLSHAHDELRAGDPNATVTTIAYRWGFPSPSRFAAYYRQAYSTSPSQTLRG